MIDRFGNWYVSLPVGSRWVATVTLMHLAAFTVAPGPAIQLPLAVLFYITCPGMILIDWLDLPDVPSRVAIAAAASLGANILIVTLLLSTGLYGPGTALSVIGGISLFVAAVTTLRLRNPLESILATANWRLR